MNYRVENQLELFEFHDALFSPVSLDREKLIISAEYLNIHKNTRQNPFNYDMEIDYAQITFTNFRALSYKYASTETTDCNPPSFPFKIISGQEAQEKIFEELENQITVYDFDSIDGSRYFIDGCGIQAFFVMEFCFDNVIVEWDKYKKKAWYELQKRYQYEITLTSPKGEEHAKIIINCNEETYNNTKHTPDINIILMYAGKEIFGHGEDFLWVDAFAHIQNQLPEGVNLKCCLTCRYGNMCPVGNKPDELFCTKNIIISQKSDLYFYTEDEAERNKRSRHYCDVCADYQPKSEEYYTYNDFPYYLK